MEKISCQALMFALKTSICITDLLKKKKPISSIKYTFPKKALREKKKKKRSSVHSLHKRKALLLVLAH